MDQEATNQTIQETKPVYPVDKLINDLIEKETHEISELGEIFQSAGEEIDQETRKLMTSNPEMNLDVHRTCFDDSRRFLFFVFDNDKDYKRAKEWFGNKPSTQQLMDLFIDLLNFREDER